MNLTASCPCSGSCTRASQDRKSQPLRVLWRLPPGHNAHIQQPSQQPFQGRQVSWSQRLRVLALVTLSIALTANQNSSCLSQHLLWQGTKHKAKAWAVFSSSISTSSSSRHRASLTFPSAQSHTNPVSVSVTQKPHRFFALLLTDATCHSSCGQALESGNARDGADENMGEAYRKMLEKVCLEGIDQRNRLCNQVESFKRHVPGSCAASDEAEATDRTVLGLAAAQSPI